MKSDVGTKLAGRAIAYSGQLAGIFLEGVCPRTPAWRLLGPFHFQEHFHGGGSGYTIDAVHQDRKPLRWAEPKGRYANLHGARKLRLVNNYVVVLNELDRVLAEYCRG